MYQFKGKCKLRAPTSSGCYDVARKASVTTGHWSRPWKLDTVSHPVKSWDNINSFAFVCCSLLAIPRIEILSYPTKVDPSFSSWWKCRTAWTNTYVVTVWINTVWSPCFAQYATRRKIRLFMCAWPNVVWTQTFTQVLKHLILVHFNPHEVLPVCWIMKSFCLCVVSLFSFCALL